MQIHSETEMRKSVLRQQYEDLERAWRLREIIHRDISGRVVRVSKFRVQWEENVLIAEAIYYEDGSSGLYLYDTNGEVREIIKCDGYGQELCSQTV